MYRQGDLLFVECSIPANAKKISNQVIAEGEYSGHEHIAYDCDVLECEGEKYLRPKTNQSVIRHEKNKQSADHQPIELPVEKTYRIVYQQQFDYFTNEWAKVLD